ncbi:MAG: large conductance mechanosensitive channel protein MscL [Tenericutes bacterium]|jgi:large conductance mechanosensitive channel|nr:large conductance mechanosensitive channel protein MscL [Mycoplasmatota bacterium]
MKNFFKEFRSFIAKGNALDLAVAFIIGVAFNAVVKSLVNDILMPIISLMFKSDLENLHWVLRGTAEYNPLTGATILSEDAILLTYGNFITEVVNFFIIALTIFVIIHTFTKMKGRLEEVKRRINPEEALEDQKTE